MTLVVAASSHGSPGVSTAVQLLAVQWPRPEAVPVIVEADASGGVLAARYGVSLTPGFVTLAESLRKHERPALLDHAQRLPSGAACISLSPSAAAASAQLRAVVGLIGPCLRSSGHPVFVDAGRLLPGDALASSLAQADVALWFVRPEREELLVLRHRLDEIAQPAHCAVVLVGSSPYNAEQVREALARPVHVLPVDARAAKAVNHGGDDRYLRRSSLARACTRLGESLQHELWVDAVADPGDPHVGSVADTLASLAPASESPPDGPAPADQSPQSSYVIVEDKTAAIDDAEAVAGGADRAGGEHAETESDEEPEVDVRVWFPAESGT